jgi:curved DNA-binding protein CbpA
MNDPYDVLGLTLHADLAELRKRYLELVRMHPPDRDPDRFAAVHAAYEALKDPAERVLNQLFKIDARNDSIEAIARDVRLKLLDVRLPVDTLLGLADAP